MNMTLEESQKIQEELRVVFVKHGISSGASFFMRGGTFHVIEAHVTEANVFVNAMINGIAAAAKQGLNIPVEEVWNDK